MILAIDPGSEKSAWLMWGDPVLHEYAIYKNTDFLFLLGSAYLGVHPENPFRIADRLVIEYPQPRGQRMTTQIVSTIFWIGRFVEAWQGPYELIDRKDVKMCLCGRTTAKDSDVRAAVIERFPATGGGKTPAIGIKASPGPLYGIRDDIWQALAVALTWSEMREGEMREIGL